SFASTGDPRPGFRSARGVFCGVIPGKPKPRPRPAPRNDQLNLSFSGFRTENVGCLAGVPGLAHLARKGKHMPELRKDPIVGRWVIIASERANRPLGPKADPQPIAGSFCPFCEGQEETT